MAASCRRYCSSKWARAGLPANQDHDRDHAEHRDEAGDERLTEVTLGEERAELIDQEGDGVAGAELEADGAPEPALALHFGVHRADGGEAGRGVEVEEEVSKRGDARETHRHGDVVRAAGEGELIHVDKRGQAIDDRQRADDVLLGDEAGDRGRRQLPDAEAERDQQEGEGGGDGSEDGGVLHALLHDLELPVEGLHDLHDGVADQDDGGGLDDVGLGALHHGLEGELQARDLELRQLHDEEGLAVLIAGDGLDEQRAEEDQHEKK